VRHRAGRGAVVGAVEADAEHGGGSGEGAPEPGSPDGAGAEVAGRGRERGAVHGAGLPAGRGQWLDGVGLCFRVGPTDWG
jgi:hypothetical protein